MQKTDPSPNDDLKNTLAPHGRAGARWTFLAVAFAMGFPSLLTWVYFVVLASWPAAYQQAAYAILKVIQFAFPVVWTWCLFRGRLKSLVPLVSVEFKHPELSGSDLALTHGACGKTRRVTSIWISVCFGLVVSASILGGYCVLAQMGLIDDRLTIRVQEKVAGMKLDTPLKFAALGVFYALVHSYLEEYYWRWFVYVRLCDGIASTMAMVVSSLGFMAHHVILLATFFGWESVLTWLFSLGVAVGGVVWAWLYRRDGLIVIPWISHLMVDAAIFGLGFFLVFGWPG